MAGICTIEIWELLENISSIVSTREKELILQDALGAAYQRAVSNIAESEETQIALDAAYQTGYMDGDDKGYETGYAQALKDRQQQQQQQRTETDMAEKKTTSSAKSATGITGASRGRPKQPVEDSEGEENEEEEDVDLDDEEEEEGEETEGSEEEEEAIRMFSNYDELKQEIADTEQQVEKVKRKMSDLVQSIHSSYGAGPFEWGGSILKISKRNDTYFFKSFTSKATKIGKS